MRMSSRAVVAVVACAAPIAAEAQPRGIRLFLSTIGLSDPNDVQSPALNPAPEFGLNPSVVAPVNAPTRLYLWAKLEPAGSPNTVRYGGVALVNMVSGAGGALSGFQFWNYTNGTYRRWQQFSHSPTGTTNGAVFAGAAVTSGAGVNNSDAAHALDMHYRRFAPDGTTRIDSTLLGWLEVSGSQIGQTISVRVLATSSGIWQSGGEPGPIYQGWGDEGIPDDPIPEAQMHIVPEPAALLLIGAGAFLCRRRRAPASVYFGAAGRDGP